MGVGYSSVDLPRQFFLIPLGPGEPKQITHDNIDHTDARFLPNGKGIVFTGIEPGHQPRIYRQAIGDDSARAISPEGVTGVIPTTDGKFVFGFSDAVALYPVDGRGTPRPVSAVHLEDQLLSVATDGRSILVGTRAGKSALNVFRVDLASGHRELFKKIAPADPAGLSTMPLGVAFTPDGKYYAYSYFRLLSTLYTVDGLR